MKQSLDDAMHGAMLHSVQFPDLEVIVFDKPHKKAMFTASPYLQKERIEGGWNMVATFKGGKQV